jgi:hypothetical protein
MKTQTQSEAPKVFQAIANVAAEMAKIGIGKDRLNPQQNFKYRGIDDLYNVLGPVMAKNKLIVLQTAETRDSFEKTSKNGSAIYYVILKITYTFVSSEDGSSYSITTFGEAMDSSDKATNKAQTSAYKYAMIQTFAIPIVGEENDPDHTSHENKPSARPITKPAPNRQQIEKLFDRVRAGEKDVLEKFQAAFYISSEIGDEIDATLKAIENENPL